MHAIITSNTWNEKVTTLGKVSQMSMTFYHGFFMDLKKTLVKHLGFNAHLIHKAVLKRHRLYFHWLPEMTSTELFRVLLFTSM